MVLDCMMTGKYCLVAKQEDWPLGYKTFIMLNITEHEIVIKHRQLKKFFALCLSDAVFIMLINVKMPTF